MSHSAHSKAEGLAWPPAQCGAQCPGQPPRPDPSLHACPEMLPCWPNSALSYSEELHCRQNLAQGSDGGVTEGRRGHWCQSTCLTWGGREGKSAFLKANKGKKNYNSLIFGFTFTFHQFLPFVMIMLSVHLFFINPYKNINTSFILDT